MTTPEWAPERVVGPELAARVIAEQFPDLADLPVRAFDAGWDNAVLAVGDDWLFRFVHREIALRGARQEVAVLRHLADRFAVPIPFPERLGTPTPEVPWPFWGTRPLPGVELARAALPDADRAAVARAVGALLRELHDPALARETVAALATDGLTLLTDPNRRSEPAVMAERGRGQLDAITALGVPVPPAARTLLAEAEHLPPADPAGAVLVHGDLHVRHLLVHDGRASGVIDWGDTALADPCVDLMIAFSAFDGAARRAFVQAYGAVPPDRELRARAAAIRVSASLARSCLVEGQDVVAAEALAAIGRATR
ncbi:MULTISPECIES: phosphotransferase [unclassified Actinotalea]|uniref:phosphotransferase n=1 Tax=unclassified Actinotalea TaxID=2638618 RepID=UPI0015F430B9|nr:MULTISPECIES: phosphotransferase [unclassified Actinotalea]